MNFIGVIDDIGKARAAGFLDAADSVNEIAISGKSS
jgi:hypothetical protein